MLQQTQTTLRSPLTAILLVVGLVFVLFVAAPTTAYGDDPNWAEETVYNLVVNGFGTLLLQAGALFDNSIEWFIVRFGEIYANNFGGAIELTWGVIRDLINFALIFGLVYVGFRFILNADEAGAKRNLGTLIIAALLVNFSLFFAKAMVDISNIASVTFANQISSGSSLGIAGSFADLLGVSTSLDPSGKLANDAPSGTEVFWGFILMNMVAFLVATFVFFAAAILILIRFIVLCFMMIFSPVVVLGWIFPFFKGLSQKWLNTFLAQAFMAPAMLLTLYCCYLVMSALAPRTTGTLGSDAEFGTGTIGALPFFILGMGFMIGSLIIAQKMGAAGASTAISIGHGARRRATGWASRNTVGRGASWAMRAQKSNNRAVRTVGRTASIATLGNRNLEGLRQNKFGGAYSRADDEKHQKEQRTRNNQIKTNNQSLNEIKAGLQALKTDEGRRTNTQRETIEKMYSTVGSLNQKQLEELGDSDKATLRSIAPLMNADQADKFTSNSDIDPSLRADVQRARQAAWKDLVEENGRVISDQLTKLNSSQLEELGGEFINANAHQLAESQVDDLMKSKKLSDAQKQNLKTNRKTKQVSWMNSGQNGAKRLFNTYDGQGQVKARYKPNDVAKLDRDVLLHNNAVPNLTANDLEAIAEQKTLPTNDRQELKRKIINESGNQNLSPQARQQVQQLANYFNTPHAQEKW